MYVYVCVYVLFCKVVNSYLTIKIHYIFERYLELVCYVYIRMYLSTSLVSLDNFWGNIQNTQCA